MSDTPESDGIAEETKHHGYCTPWPDFARRLERERNEAQSLVKTLSVECDQLEAGKEYNAELAMELAMVFAAECDQLRAINAELLDALERLTSQMMICDNDHDVSVRVFQIPTGEVRLAKAAITKAKGAQS